MESKIEERYLKDKSEYEALKVNQSSDRIATIIEHNKLLRNKLSELYEAYGSAVDITPELLQSVAQTLKETEDGK